jgi:DNA-binding NtrC family response regulator
MQKHILVMEDNEVLRQLYTRALRTTGQAVYQAASIQEARSLLNQHSFDIFLCDMEVGGERGIDLLQEQHDNLHYSGTHVIVASAEERYRDDCEALGVDLFLEKPLEITPLVTLVGRLMSN